MKLMTYFLDDTFLMPTIYVKFALHVKLDLHKENGRTRQWYQLRYTLRASLRDTL